MKKGVVLWLTCFFQFAVWASSQQPSILADTLRENQVAQQQLIDQVLASSSAPSSAKAATLHSLTQYGFKNLFTQFGSQSKVNYGSQVNPNAEAYMQDYLKQHRTHLLNMKNWGLPYFNLIENIFSLYGVPHELKYLAVIESNLSAEAISIAGAVGPWQFMPETGRSFGLIINTQTDQRRDYFKSTHAAARYLLQLYRTYTDWLLVIAAYNGGPGRVNDAIQKSGSRDFWLMQSYLPTESKNHVKKFIATHYVMENESTWISHTQVTNPGLITDSEKNVLSTEKISGKYLAHIIAGQVKMDGELFNKYNPSFDNRLAEEGSYNLVLPEEKMKLFLQNKYQILEASVQFMLSDNQTSFPAPTPKPASNKKKNIKHP